MASRGGRQSLVIPHPFPSISVVMPLNEYNVAYDVLPKDLWCSPWQRSVETSLRTLAWAACLGGRGAGECGHHKLSHNFGSLHELAKPRGEPLTFNALLAFTDKVFVSRRLG